VCDECRNSWGCPKGIPDDDCLAPDFMWMRYQALSASLAVIPPFFCVTILPRERNHFRLLETHEDLCRAKGLAHDLIVTRNGGMITLWSSTGIRHSVFDSAARICPDLNMRAICWPSWHSASSPFCLVLVGARVYPAHVAECKPADRVEAVEIDPAVVELAVRYFDIRALPASGFIWKKPQHFSDAALQGTEWSSSTPILRISFRISGATTEFISDARRCMLDGGVLAVNWMSGICKNARSC